MSVKGQQSQKQLSQSRIQPSLYHGVSSHFVRDAGAIVALDDDGDVNDMNHEII